MRTRVKICGITRVSDAVSAARLGVDAIGLNFFPPSPRVVDLSQALEIRNAVPIFVSVVALFVNASPREIEAVIETISPDVLQFHGVETPVDCERYRRPYVKAIRVRAGVDVRAEADRFVSARALLLDAWHEKLWGGSGQAFDWRMAPVGGDKPIILAGGLTPENVRPAIEAVKPYAVDVSGGVESAKGIKDVAKMAAFMGEVTKCSE